MRPFPLVAVDVLERAPRRTAGVDHQGVETSEFIDGTLDGELRLFGVCDVCGGSDNADSVRAHRLGRRLQGGVCTGAHADVGTLGSELYGDCPAHALARRGNECSAST